MRLPVSPLTTSLIESSSCPAPGLTWSPMVTNIGKLERGRQLMEKQMRMYYPRKRLRVSMDSDSDSTLVRQPGDLSNKERLFSLKEEAK